MNDQCFNRLRNQARARLERPQTIPDLSPGEIGALYHELQVHQVELELQNEQLLESQSRAEQSLEKYRQLFLSIPIGYATIDSRGYVIDCNPTGFNLLKLKPGSSFTFNQFLAPQDADRFILLCRNVLSTNHPAECAVPFIRSDQSHAILSIRCFALTPLKEKRLGLTFEDITSQVEAEKTLRANQAELQLLTRKLFTAQEEERQKIARDLHDDFAQRVTGMMFETQFLEKNLKERQEAHDRIARLKKGLKGLLDEFRFMARALKPLDLAHESLTHSMRDYTTEFGKQTNLKIKFLDANAVQELPRDCAMHLYRVLQESLSNVAKHANATAVEITIARTENGIEMTIADNGRGFDLKSAFQQRKGMGLVSIQERIRQMGGRIAIESSSKGTSIQVYLSFPQALTSNNEQKGVRKCA